MKLITEHTDQELSYITEQDKNGKKKLIIEGIFMQADQKNRNGRIYPKDVLEQAVNKYTEQQVSKGRAVGELNHPEGPTINLDKVSHKITDLKFEGNNVVGRATVLNTPMGQIAQGLIEGGVQLGVSSRGMGSLDTRGGTNYVKGDFMLNAVDIVQDPSAPGAYVNGIMEGVEWIMENGTFKRQEIEKLETEIKLAPSPAKQMKAFKDFLSNL
tara:strand:- start:1547 stop:2185 length:639 start_codon:yes stop_codon:yes gene_type:complete